VAFDFPGSPVLNQVWTAPTGQGYTWSGTAWNLSSPATSQTATARSKNFVINPSMQHSQENGNTAGTTTGYYPADQWRMDLSGIVMQVNRPGAAAAGPSPEGSLSVGMLATTAKGSLAAGDFAQLAQPLEGNQIADLAWGTAKAKPAVLRFNVYPPVAGTYNFSILSGGTDESYIGSYVVTTPNVWQTVVAAIPVPPAGTWASDNTVAAYVRFAYATGTSFVGVAGWQGGNKMAVTQPNLAAVTNQILFVTDVALYADPNNTGLPAPFQVP